MTATDSQYSADIASLPYGPQRVLPMFLAAVIGLSIAGYFVGMLQHDRRGPARAYQPTVPAPPDVVPARGGAIPAPTYSEIGHRPKGPNAGWQVTMASLVPAARPLEATRPADREAARAATVGARPDHRAYDGAPPVIPHAVDQIAARACLSCHQNGLWIGDAFAPVVSHPIGDTDCTACHVEQSSTLRSLDGGPGEVANHFAGRLSQPGDREQPLGPPTVPHTTRMIEWSRADCMSCHGPQGRPGLVFTLDNTAHAESSGNSRCMSCHVQDAAWRDDRPAR